MIRSSVELTAAVANKIFRIPNAYQCVILTCTAAGSAESKRGSLVSKNVPLAITAAKLVCNIY